MALLHESTSESRQGSLIDAAQQGLLWEPLRQRPQGRGPGGAMPSGRDLRIPFPQTFSLPDPLGRASCPATFFVREPPASRWRGLGPVRMPVRQSVTALLRRPFSPVKRHRVAERRCCSATYSIGGRTAAARRDRDGRSALGTFVGQARRLERAHRHPADGSAEGPSGPRQRAGALTRGSAARPGNPRGDPFNRRSRGRRAPRRPAPSARP